MTEEQYNKAILRIERLMDAEAETPEMEELIKLSAEVEAYEKVHCPLDCEITKEDLERHNKEQRGIE